MVCLLFLLLCVACLVLVVVCGCFIVDVALGLDASGVVLGSMGVLADCFSVFVGFSRCDFDYW